MCFAHGFFRFAQFPQWLILIFTLNVPAIVQQLIIYTGCAWGVLLTVTHTMMMYHKNNPVQMFGLFLIS